MSGNRSELIRNILNRSRADLACVGLEVSSCKDTQKYKQENFVWNLLVVQEQHYEPHQNHSHRNCCGKST
jgi:hypothetical protein